VDPPDAKKPPDGWKKLASRRRQHDLLGLDRERGADVGGMRSWVIGRWVAGAARQAIVYCAALRGAMRAIVWSASS